MQLSTPYWYGFRERGIVHRDHYPVLFQFEKLFSLTPPEQSGRPPLVSYASLSLPPLQFLRLSRDTPPQIVFTLMTAHWGVPSPNLVVSVVGGGGEGQEKVKPWVREVMRNGLVRAAQSTGEAGGDEVRAGEGGSEHR